MTTQFKEWFVAERAKALAMVLLTRRVDLVVRETREESGLDFTVCLQSEDVPGKRPFGVLMQSAMSPVTIEQANERLKPIMSGMKGLGPFGFPVCVFYFTAKDDQGYCTWGHEPVIVDGQAKLKVHSEARCQQLDDATLEEIVGVVKRWYEAFFAAVIV